MRGRRSIRLFHSATPPTTDQPTTESGRTRLRRRTHKPRTSLIASSPECPVCGSIIAGDLEAVTAHVDHCLGSQSDIDEEYADIPITIQDALGAEQPVLVDGFESRYGKPQYTFDSIRKLLSAHQQHQQHRPVKVDSKTKPTSELEALQERLRECQDQLERSPKCLICLEAPVDPVISVQCWHVYCEVCWAGVMVSKRLCPQCKRIAAPADLRRIYLS